MIVAAVVTAEIVVKSADRQARAATPTSTTVTGVAGTAATPLWSPRRIPQLIGALAELQRFAAVIASFAAPGRCVAVDGPAGPLARVAATTPLAPASTEKLLTGAVALNILGPSYVFRTTAVATAPISGGVLEGNVYLVGGGDPVLATPAYRRALAANRLTAGEPTTGLDDLAAALVAAGVRRIDGAVVADDSREETLRYLPTLKPSERVDIGPLGALTVDAGRAPNGVAAPDPALLTAGSLAVLLHARGVAVSEGVRRGTAPSAARTLASVTSPRLDAIVASMLTFSNNYTAEMLLRADGVAVYGTGSTSAGLRVVMATLPRLGVPTAGVSLVDGSGLSPDDRVTCAALLTAVELGDRLQDRALRVGLPVAGRTGTLAQRFLGDPLAGRLMAKTGNIDGVVGLAGIVDTAGGSVRFAFLANGAFSTAGGAALQNDVAHLVAEYPTVPAPGRLVPAPAA
jgi:D-alanyl-D-alanine carboxypeptidase/D-alanyl-D-alanine-endopeptidase (penicillin-binding protein 4)